jgi:hypothetical protein
MHPSTSAPPDRRRRRAAVGGPLLGLAAVLASALAAGCDYPLHPYRDNSDAPFSMVGYLDLKADTQWVRVMPVRQNLLLDPAPIDGVVTLEQAGTGRVVTLNDSVFGFSDPRIDGVAYAHNFWTTERLEPGTTYQLRAVRSDGASTTALVEMPPDLRFSYLNDAVDEPGFVFLLFRAGNVLSVDVLHTMMSLIGGSVGMNPVWEPAGKVAVRQNPPIPTTEPGVLATTADAKGLLPGALFDVGRLEIRIVAARSDWPYLPDLSDLEVTLPGTMPSNVEHGFGFVGGVSTWTIPFTHCVTLVPSPGRQESCQMQFDGQSTSVAGRVISQPCTDPYALEPVYLTETFADGGKIRLKWKTGWQGEYRFDGLEPGADLVLEFDPGDPVVQLPPLTPGQRYRVGDLFLQHGCAPVNG